MYLEPDTTFSTHESDTVLAKRLPRRGLELTKVMNAETNEEKFNGMYKLT
jgi:hypothetical protein